MDMETNLVVNDKSILDIYDLSPEDKNKYYHLYQMFIDNLAEAKASVFVKSSFSGSDRLNQILKNNKWYRKFPISRKESLIMGDSWVMALKSHLYRDINLRLLRSIVVQYIDDKLIYFSGTNMDIYPDTTRIYDYFQFELKDNQTVYRKGIMTYRATKWTIDLNNSDEVILPTNNIPVWLLPMNESTDSMFKYKQWLIGLCVNHLFKIDKDIKLGTNKFLLNIRGVPTGKGFIETLRQYEKILEKGTIVTDTMLMINPNSSNPMDRMYGSLQSEQLWYGFKMALGQLKEQCKITTNSSSKTSAQQNTLEIAQENSLIESDNQKNKFIWENALEEMAWGILKFDNDILFGDNDLEKEVKCTITVNRTLNELNNKSTNNNPKKGE